MWTECEQTVGQVLEMFETCHRVFRYVPSASCLCLNVQRNHQNFKLLCSNEWGQNTFIISLFEVCPRIRISSLVTQLSQCKS